MKGRKRMTGRMIWRRTMTMKRRAGMRRTRERMMRGKE
jgi:hypothetical protein